MLAAHVDVAGVNLMTMDFGASKPKSTSMIAATEQALTAGQGQVQAAYLQAGEQISSAQAWNKIGATPMIGQNDTADEQFTTADAQKLVAFATSNGMGRLSFWSLNRDMPCGPNDPTPGQAANNCSGVSQQPLAFSAIFNQLPGRSATAASAVTEAVTAPKGPDNPATSPYPVWDATSNYPAATKVVWKHTIYQAKWWNQGEAPNTPVTSATDTPWTLIGPVLPGQKAATTTTVPVGTYPAWSATAAYAAGSQVLYQGVGYQAKWWNQGTTPDAADPGGSAWQAMA
jgi:chitinase